MNGLNFPAEFSIKSPVILSIYVWRDYFTEYAFCISVYELLSICKQYACLLFAECEPRRSATSSYPRPYYGWIHWNPVVLFWTYVRYLSIAISWLAKGLDELVGGTAPDCLIQRRVRSKCGIPC